MGITGAPKTGFFYPRISYGGTPTLIDFDEPATIVLPSEIPVRIDNIAETGAQESCYYRTEQRLILAFGWLGTAKLEEVKTWWTTHASQGKQSAVTLDRLATCGGQWEYDRFNTTFTKAHLLNNPFEPRRLSLARVRYTLQLFFRQGV